jgi:Trk K+ transport system NAD-binding subunit
VPPITPSLPSGRWRPVRRAHIVVCGANQLAYRVVEELVTRYGEYVTVIVPSRDEGWAPEIDELDGAKLVEAARLDGGAFRSAKLRQARALALLDGDDVGNLHAALRAREFKRDLPLVVRMANRNLRDRMHDLIDACTALSDASTAAPAFVAAALDRRVPVRLPNQSLVVVRRHELQSSNRPICTLTAGIDQSDRPPVLPDTDGPDDLVLATADGPSPDPVPYRAPWMRRAARQAGHVLRLGPRRGLVALVLVLLGLILVGVLLRSTVLHEGTWYAFYDSLMTVSGAGNPDRTLPVLEQVVQVLTTVCGVSLIPAITAAMVDWVVRVRLVVAQPRPDIPRAGHVIVSGLGEVGTRIVRALDDMGEPVVAIEKDEHVSGVDFARRRGIPVIVGDATEPATLARAHVESCRALVPVASDDATNLEAGLNARSDHPQLRVVLRLFDGELAARVQRQLGITTSRSVAYLAAPVFAAALVDRQVINTIPVGRRVLLIADIPVGEGTGLTDVPVSGVDEPGECRVIALRTGDDWRWTPPADHRLAATERVVVIATRAGLGRALVRSAVLEVAPT